MFFNVLSIVFFSQECSSSLHHFQKYQDLPTRGAHAVEQFSINGSQFLAFANYKGDVEEYSTASFIYKLNSSDVKFFLYQAINTSGGRDIEYFTIVDKHYLAVASRQPSQQNSTIYQWNGQKFVVVQNIPTIGGTRFRFFSILQELFLAITNTDSINSVIYKWRNNTFEMFQEIATEQSRACTAFVINNETFIVFASYQSSQQGHSVQSPVYKWSGSHFVQLQSLQTYGAWDVKSFNGNSETFLAFANFYDGNSHSIDSFIYKWDGSKFVLFQSIPTHGAKAWHPFVMCGQTFLGVANFYDSRVVLYQATGEQFTKYQEISTQTAVGMTTFEYKGHTFLAFAIFRNGSKFNTNSMLYNLI